MLVLGRQLEESIIIDSKILITITRIKDGAVRLAVTAPPTMHIDKGEYFPEVVSKILADAAALKAQRHIEKFRAANGSQPAP